MSRATPLNGISGEIERPKPIAHYWPKAKPESEADAFRALFPHLRPGGTVDYRRCATFGFAQSQLARLEAKIGFAKACKSHTFRGWGPTCDSQLRYSREGRGELGHWAPGGVMPDRYDKATCAPELKMRDGIFGEVRSGWRLKKASDAWGVMPSQENAVDSGSDSETSPTSARGRREEEDISQLYFVPTQTYTDYF